MSAPTPLIFAEEGKPLPSQREATLRFIQRNGPKKPNHVPPSELPPEVLIPPQAPAINLRAPFSPDRQPPNPPLPTVDPPRQLRAYEHSPPTKKTSTPAAPQPAAPASTPLLQPKTAPSRAPPASGANPPLITQTKPNGLLPSQREATAMMVARDGPKKPNHVPPAERAGIVGPPTTAAPSETTPPKREPVTSVKEPVKLAVEPARLVAKAAPQPVAPARTEELYVFEPPKPLPQPVELKPEPLPEPLPNAGANPPVITETKPGGLLPSQREATAMMVARNGPKKPNHVPPAERPGIEGPEVAKSEVQIISRPPVKRGQPIPFSQVEAAPQPVAKEAPQPVAPARTEELYVFEPPKSLPQPVELKPEPLPEPLPNAGANPPVITETKPGGLLPSQREATAMMVARNGPKKPNHVPPLAAPVMLTTEPLSAPTSGSSANAPVITSGGPGGLLPSQREATAMMVARNGPKKPNHVPPAERPGIEGPEVAKSEVQIISRPPVKRGQPIPFSQVEAAPQPVAKEAPQPVAPARTEELYVFEPPKSLPQPVELKPEPLPEPLPNAGANPPVITETKPVGLLPSQREATAMMVARNGPKKPNHVPPLAAPVMLTTEPLSAPTSGSSANAPVITSGGPGGLLPSQREATAMMVARDGPKKPNHVPPAERAGIVGPPTTAAPSETTPPKREPVTSVKEPVKLAVEPARLVAKAAPQPVAPARTEELYVFEPPKSLPQPVELKPEPLPEPLPNAGANPPVITETKPGGLLPSQREATAMMVARNGPKKPNHVPPAERPGIEGPPARVATPSKPRAAESSAASIAKKKTQGAAAQGQGASANAVAKVSAPIGSTISTSGGLLDNKAVRTAFALGAAALTVFSVYKGVELYNRYCLNKCIAEIEREEPEVVHLYIHKRSPLSPSVSIPCTFVETFLRVAGVPYIPHVISDTSVSPNGQLPFIVYGEERTAGSRDIVKALTRQFGVALDQRLTREENATGVAIMAALEYSFDRAYNRSIHVDSVEAITPYYSEMNRTPDWITRMALSRLRSRTQRTNDVTGYSHLSTEQYQQQMEKDAVAIEGLLAQQDFLFSSAQPSLYDCALYAWLLPIVAMESAVDVNCAFEHIVQSEPLTSFVKRMTEIAFPDLDELVEYGNVYEDDPLSSRLSGRDGRDEQVDEVRLHAEKEVHGDSAVMRGAGEESAKRLFF